MGVNCGVPVCAKGEGDGYAPLVGKPVPEGVRVGLGVADAGPWLIGVLVGNPG